MFWSTPPCALSAVCLTFSHPLYSPSGTALFCPLFTFCCWLLLSPCSCLSGASIHFADFQLSNEDLFKAVQFDLILMRGENCILCCSRLPHSLVILTSQSLLYLCVRIILKTVISCRNTCIKLSICCMCKADICTFAFVFGGLSVQLVFDLDFVRRSSPIVIKLPKSEIN